MDSQDRDESRNRRRQETLARRLGEALDEIDSRNAGDCPDGEILAVYAEQGLGHAEAEKWESHFGTCPRCRKILLVLSASADTPLADKEVTHLGQLVSTVHAPVDLAEKSASRSRSRFQDWRVRWLAPALGAAAVLVVWFAMRPPWRGVNRGASEALVAQAPKQEMPPSPPPTELDQRSIVAPQPQEDQKALAGPARDRLSAKTPSDISKAGAAADSAAAPSNALKKVEPSAGFAGGALQKEKSAGNSPADAELAAPASLAPAPLPQSQANGAAAPALGIPGPTSQSSPSVTVTEAAPTVGTTNQSVGSTVQQESSAAVPLNGRNAQALIRLRPARGFSVLVKAKSGSTLWRAGNGGIIQRSTDAGKSWLSQTSPTQENWLAGVAVSDSVCWLVGRNGAIARTVDGANWEAVLPPPVARDASGKFPDWVSITAMDAQSATVTAGEQRRYSTIDAGQTWQAQ